MEILISRDQIILKDFQGTYRKPNIWDTTAVEYEISTMNYTGMGRLRMAEVECTKLPSGIIVFYNYIFKTEEIPDMDKYIELYRAYYTDKLQGIHVTALEGRLARMYPSILRDFHFYVMCTQYFRHSNVYYSTRVDFELGYDLIIDEFGICLYVDTYHSRSYRKVKYKRHNSMLRDIEVPLKLGSATKHGNIYLYSKDDVKFVHKEINRLRETGNDY